MVIFNLFKIYENVQVQLCARPYGKFTDLRDDQGNLPFWPIPRLEAIAATQLTRRRFLPDKFAACMS